jgi:hypothetical protein
MNDGLPDFGDLDGLERLVRQAIEAIERMDLPDAEREAWTAELEAAYRAARGKGRNSYRNSTSSL